MKGILSKTLCVCLAVGSLFLADGFSYAAKAEENGNAQTQTNATHAELFLPTSYEQYLPLKNPTDIAVGENHIAVADGKTVYVYSSLTERYDVYTHSENVNELQFSGEKLYFLDQTMCFFMMNANDLPDVSLTNAQALQHCNSFVIWSDTLFFTTLAGGKTQIFSAPLSEPLSQEKRSTEFSSETYSALALSDGELYYTIENVNSHLYRLGNESTEEIMLPDKTISSIAMLDGVLYYTTSNGFYAYTLSDLKTNGSTAQPIFKETTGSYSALTAADDGYIYAVCPSWIQRYDPRQKQFDEYVIASSSTKNHRLAKATDVTLCGNYLFAADKANRSVSVTDVQTRKTTAIFLDFECEQIAADSKTILVANQSQAALIDLSSYEKRASFASFASPIVGITNVYGTYYIATQTGFYKITESVEESGKTYKLSALTPAQNTPNLLASDIYGKIYVGYASGSLFSYTEEELMDASTVKSESDKIATLPSDAEKLIVNFERNVYALKEGTLHLFQNEQWRAQSLAKAIVYSQDDNTKVSSLCFDVVENTAYILYDGNFIVKTNEFNLPVLTQIPVRNAAQSVFGETEEFTLVQIDKNTLYVQFDIQALQGATLFPYLAYERKIEEKTALKLGETGRFNLVAVFEQDSKQYTVALVEKVSCSREIAKEEFLKPAQDFANQQTGYTTNRLSLYKYPYLTELLTVCELPKNAKVTVLGEIEELDYRYYLVEYIDQTGATRVGYLPKTYVSVVNGEYPEADTIVKGDTVTDEDSVWRAAFILLGFSAIAVLVDFLILRKKR